MKITQEQLLTAAKKAGFQDKDYGLMSYRGTSDFNDEIGVEEYACGDKVLALMAALGIEVTR